MQASQAKNLYTVDGVARANGISGAFETPSDAVEHAADQVRRSGQPVTIADRDGRVVLLTQEPNPPGSIVAHGDPDSVAHFMPDPNEACLGWPIRTAASRPTSPPPGAEVGVSPTEGFSCCPTCDLRREQVEQLSSFPANIIEVPPVQEHEPLATRIRRETATAILAGLSSASHLIEWSYDELTTRAIDSADNLLDHLADTQEVRS